MITEYERGLLDMMNELTVTDQSGKVETQHLAGVDLRNCMTPLIVQALDARKKLDEQTKLDQAVALLKAAGFAVHDPKNAPSIESATEFLRHAGYTVTTPAPQGVDMPVNLQRPPEDRGGVLHFTDAPREWVGKSGPEAFTPEPLEDEAAIMARKIVSGMAASSYAVYSISPRPRILSDEAATNVIASTILQ